MASSSAPSCASVPARLDDTPPPVAEPIVLRVVDDADVVARLRAAVAAAGSQRAYALQAGLNESDLSSALSGRRPPSTPLRRAVGVEQALVLREGVL